MQLHEKSVFLLFRPHCVRFEAPFLIEYSNKHPLSYEIPVNDHLIHIFRRHRYWIDFIIRNVICPIIEGFYCLVFPSPEVISSPLPSATANSAAVFASCSIGL